MSIPFKDVKKLIQLLEDSALAELEVTSQEGLTVRVAKPQSHPVAAVPQLLGSAHETIVSSEAVSTPVTSSVSTDHAVKSPIVGTVYLSPEPDAPTFVEVGQKVQIGDVLCIVEAMKMFNKIKADRAGVVSACCVENGQVVDYDRSLFTIKETEAHGDA